MSLRARVRREVNVVVPVQAEAAEHTKEAHLGREQGGRYKLFRDEDGFASNAATEVPVHQP